MIRDVQRPAGKGVMPPASVSVLGHLGLQVQIKIRYHIYWCDCVTGVVFIENPSFLGAIFVLQVKNVKAFSPDGRITGQGEDS